MKSFLRECVQFLTTTAENIIISLKKPGPHYSFIQLTSSDEFIDFPSKPMLPGNLITGTQIKLRSTFVWNDTLIF